MTRCAVALSWCLLLVAVGCGKKGPPLPPLVRQPAAPADFTASRRAATVVLRFVVPTANVDGVTPADLRRVDVYAYDGPSTATAAEILRRGTKVGSVVVNPPSDPDASQEEIEQAKAAAPPGALEQGAVARLTDTLTAAEIGRDTEVRSYIAVGVNDRGRNGTPAARAVVPLGPSPAAPPPPDVTYDETNVMIDWSSTLWSADEPSTYVLYGSDETADPIHGPSNDNGTFVGPVGEWGTARCYVLRTVETVDGLALQSEGSEPVCVTPTDTFAPAAPSGLQTIAGEGAINLIWDPSAEPDLAGYIVLRALAPQTVPEPLTPAAISETTYRDTLPPGTRASYAVQAVDRTGNRSPVSPLVEETAR